MADGGDARVTFGGVAGGRVGESNARVTFLIGQNFSGRCAGAAGNGASGRVAGDGTGEGNARVTFGVVAGPVGGRRRVTFLSGHSFCVEILVRASVRRVLFWVVSVDWVVRVTRALLF